MSSVILNVPFQPRLIPLPAMAPPRPPASPPPLSTRFAGSGPRLRAARKAAGWASAAQFARAIGASPQRLANWEAGDHPPPAEFLALLKQDFGIGADWILSGDLGALSGRVLQALVNAGGTPDADEVAREARAALPQMADPLAPPAPRTLHQRAAGPPGRFVHDPNVQRG